ncbi:hypothetical protein Leryth_023917 [Lithospermum erythrorhizon]|nr:hypothetical protein Leryth_023917 [Lithospermum erythrorhizon]
MKDQHEQDPGSLLRSSYIWRIIRCLGALLCVTYSWRMKMHEAARYTLFVARSEAGGPNVAKVVDVGGGGGKRKMEKDC